MMNSFTAQISSALLFPLHGFPRYGVSRFMKLSLTGVSMKEIVLDAGAGASPYRNLIRGIYHSCDFSQTNPSAESAQHTFLCDLASLPVGDNTYSTVICNQVLEHVRDPQTVIGELFRVLKPGGKLILTAPGCYGEHMIPYNYYNFLQYGLTMLFENAGFKEIRVSALGGVFWVLGKTMQEAGETAMRKLCPQKGMVYSLLLILFRAALLPISVLMYCLDPLDHEKKWTLGYGCVAIKPDPSLLQRP